MTRFQPNILVTGTPGVGKSTLCKEISEKLNFEWIDVSNLAISKGFIDGYDDDLMCPILDEDKVVDNLDPIMESGGKIVEYHGCDFFPERWFDVVFVIRANNTILYDRLEERGYNEPKIRKNVECEIFQSILEEAVESYKPSIVIELHNNDQKDFEKNIQTIIQWTIEWLKNDEHMSE